MSDDGAIFISIDDHEVAQLRKLCDEIFGESNFIAQINWKGRGGRQDSKYYAAVHEYILCYAKQISNFEAGEEIKSGDIYPKYDEIKKRYYKTQLLRKWGSNSRREDRPNLFYPITAPDGTDVYPMIRINDSDDDSGQDYVEGRWRHGPDTMKKNIADGHIEFVKQIDGSWIPYEKIFAPAEGEELTKKYSTWIDETNNGSSVLKKLFGSTVFDYPKTPSLINRFFSMAKLEDGDTVLDFFSGSSTTAHAALDYNINNNKHVKFIQVQLPEAFGEGSEAVKLGFTTLCDVGKERIRRAGKEIQSSFTQTTLDGKKAIDIGFRVLKLDSSNMKEVYYTPDKTSWKDIDSLVDNVKEGRTPQDLLFQTMLDLGVELSSSIRTTKLETGGEVFDVSDGYLLACFDPGIGESTVIEIAKKQPVFAVFRDSSMDSDSTATNFEQIFKTYSPNTTTKVI